MTRRWVVLFVACLLWAARPALAYGVLAHEAIIDAVWDSSISPLLRARFHPSAAALAQARAFAYGGAIIQDSGYYPFSSRTFGDFTHYVRSGDFIAALIHEASDVDEYAFALGALAHYAADTDGHPLAINRAVPLIYPKLAAKYGARMTYEDNPSAHIRTEFGFDVVQVARGTYVPQAYHDFIGFEVSTPVLERAFRSVYGLELTDVFGNYDMAIGTFRWAVSQAIPSMTQVAWQTRRKDIERNFPDATSGGDLFSLTRADFERTWGTHYRRPNPWQRMLGWAMRIMPKIGPFRALAFEPPTLEAGRLFNESFTNTLTRYRGLLAELRRGSLTLTNRNFDTGQPAKAGEYRLADAAYAEWLRRLDDDDFAGLTPGMRAGIVAFYGSLDAPRLAQSQARHQRRAVLASLSKLQDRRKWRGSRCSGCSRCSRCFGCSGSRVRQSRRLWGRRYPP